MKKRVLTGDRPTGKLHLGHYIGSLKNRLYFQDRSEDYDSFIMVADVQALTDHADTPEIIKNNTFEVIKDYLSVGIDPKKTTLFIQSQIPEIAELTLYFLNLVSVSRLERNPTVKQEIQQKHYERNLPAGFLCYPINQAADIALFKTEIVPVGEDQVPMIEQTNELVKKFNTLYNTHCLKKCDAFLSKTPRLIGLDGKAKASKSLKNAIYLCDSEEDLRKKVNSMYTDPNHLRINDPGRVEGNTVFAYLDAFHSDVEEVTTLKQQYQKGGLGDKSIKSLLYSTLSSLLAPIRANRAALSEKKIQEIAQEGTEQARLIAQETLSQVKAAMHIDYFIRKA